jgi:hypothetical protein
LLADLHQDDLHLDDLSLDDLRGNDLGGADLSVRAGYRCGSLLFLVSCTGPENPAPLRRADFAGLDTLAA